MGGWVRVKWMPGRQDGDEQALMLGHRLTALDYAGWEAMAQHVHARSGHCPCSLLLIVLRCTYGTHARKAAGHAAWGSA